MSIALDFEISVYRGPHDLEHRLSISLDVTAITEVSREEDAFGPRPKFIAIKDLVIDHSYIFNKSENRHEKFGNLPLDDARKIMKKACELAEPIVAQRFAQEGVA